jgi:hypothetical protein
MRSMETVGRGVDPARSGQGATMNYALRCAISAVLALLLCADRLTGARVKKKDGQVVKGEVKDLLVQKGEVEILDKEDGTKSYTIRCILTNGDRITAIDEKGIRSKWITSVGATEEGQRSIPDTWVTLFRERPQHAAQSLSRQHHVLMAHSTGRIVGVRMVAELRRRSASVE